MRIDTWSCRRRARRKWGAPGNRGPDCPIMPGVRIPGDIGAIRTSAAIATRTPVVSVRVRFAGQLVEDRALGTVVAVAALGEVEDGVAH